MTIYLISDHHFNHANMLTFTHMNNSRLVRPEFANVDEMNRFMIDRHNATVRDQDHVYFLGDVAIKWSSRDRELVKQMRGHKRLVLGNHDSYEMKNYIGVFEKVFSSRRIDRHLLTHIPIHPQTFGPKLVGNIHGHIHERVMADPRYFNVSVEQVGYTPIAFEEVTHRIQARINTAHAEGLVLDGRS